MHNGRRGARGDVSDPESSPQTPQGPTHRKHIIINKIPEYIQGIYIIITLDQICYMTTMPLILWYNSLGSYIGSI